MSLAWKNICLFLDRLKDVGALELNPSVYSVVYDLFAEQVANCASTTLDLREQTGFEKGCETRAIRVMNQVTTKIAFASVGTTAVIVPLRN